MNNPIPLRFYCIYFNKLGLLTFLYIISFNSFLLLVPKHESCTFHDYQNTFLYENDIHQHHIFTKGKTHLLHLHLSNNTSYCKDDSKGNFFCCCLILLMVNVSNLIKPIGIAVCKSFAYFAVHFKPRRFSPQEKIGWKYIIFYQILFLVNGQWYLYPEEKAASIGLL